MSIEQTTPWFPGSVKPVRVGWYEVICKLNMFNYVQTLYWSGLRWEGPGIYHSNSGFYMGSCDSWRGLTRQAE